MKQLTYLLGFLTFISFQTNVSAQELNNTTDYSNRHAIYDYDVNTISNTASIPDVETKKDQFKITGTVYMSDGVTPAKDVILYIEQPNEKGNYEMKKQDGKRYVHHRAWVKTDADGRYTFYTFMPGNYHSRGEFKHIHSVIKEEGKPAYALNAFLFDNDVSLSKYCRKRLAKKGIDTVLTIEEKDTVFVATKDIVLKADTSL